MQTRKGSVHLMLRSLARATRSNEEASDSNKSSGMEWNVKLGWCEGLRELKFVCIMVMEKPLEWRMVASSSMGFIWPWNGNGNSTNLRPFLCSIWVFIWFSIWLLLPCCCWRLASLYLKRLPSIPNATVRDSINIGTCTYLSILDYMWIKKRRVAW